MAVVCATEHGRRGGRITLAPTDGHSLTFAAGNSAAGATQTITITATDDNAVGDGRVVHGDAGDRSGLHAVRRSYRKKSGARPAPRRRSPQSDPITINISGPANVWTRVRPPPSNYTVSLSPDGVTPTADLTVSYGTSNGTATAGTDYTAASGTSHFHERSRGSTRAFTVQTTEDTFDETGETFTVTIIESVGRRWS